MGLLMREQFAKDSVCLCGGCRRLCVEEQAGVFLSGRYVAAAGDVEELEKRMDEIVRIDKDGGIKVGGPPGTDGSHPCPLERPDLAICVRIRAGLQAASLRALGSRTLRGFALTVTTHISDLTLRRTSMARVCFRKCWPML